VFWRVETSRGIARKRVSLDSVAKKLQGKNRCDLARERSIARTVSF